MFLFFDFFSRAFNFDAKAAQSHEAHGEALRIQALRQQRQQRKDEAARKRH
ncbi:MULTISPECIES: hypothetical protein [unclassified Pseudomonas]|uniref:hypothetical protein n=1 Tax=unclassified Pseudomonas TaxID=196821 RepID=UPI0018D90456|nr:MULTISPECIES: hypothetical protein [Pseudomonas]MBH3341803.1 hypothetical protein [Pseudomonas mendocina]